MKKTYLLLLLIVGSCSVLLLMIAQQTSPPAGSQKTASRFDQQVERNRNQMFEQGKQIFRFDTFGDEAFWSGALRLHQAIAGEKNGGVGPGVSPKAALAVGLKVDTDALPAELVEQIKAGKANL